MGILAAPGDLIAPGTAIVQLASPSALQARLGIEVEDAPRVAVGASVRYAPSITALHKRTGDPAGRYPHRPGDADGLGPGRHPGRRGFLPGRRCRPTSR